VSVCRSCGAPILWATTAAGGKRIPLDPDPQPDGNLLLTYPSPGSAPLAVHVDPEQLALDDQLRYLTHFVTCPQADQHRKRTP
jgi:hypothetical protein